MRTSIPGLSDLQPADLGATTIEEHRRVINAVSNVRDPLLFGLQAIGHIVWVLGTYRCEQAEDPELERPHLAGLGVLIQSLAEQIEHLDHVAGHARYQESALKQAALRQSIPDEKKTRSAKAGS